MQLKIHDGGFVIAVICRLTLAFAFGSATHTGTRSDSLCFVNLFKSGMQGASRP
jgi:hypothetical protein